MPNPLKEYLATLTPVQRVALANRANTSPGALRLTAEAYRTKGKLTISPEFAARLEKASKGAITRAQLAPVCAACPHVKP